MPALINYRLFISHSWAYGDAYTRLVDLLDAQPNFLWTNYSVPKDDPIHDAPNQAALFDAIKAQMSPVNCVIMLAGVYSTHSKWINKEIQLAKSVFNKPLIAIEPWGAERTSQVVKDNSDEIVKWNGASVVAAIRKHSI
jgi:hypothetical protein